ncbi:MAG: hypothetical protein ACK40O_07530 [Allosphingosinicella sp.]
MTIPWPPPLGAAITCCRTPAISRAEAARAPTTRALGDLDALALRQAEEAALGAADYALLVDAIERVAALRDGQDQALAALRPV